MAVRSAIASTVDEAEARLRNDPHWLLVQRIAESKSFEKASQLRNILLYITRAAILEPERVLREYDIAFDVLERRKDFNPANDNIVRSQFSNLRRKLEIYFGDEGKSEPLVVRIPKGSYAPVFTTPSFELKALPDSTLETSPALETKDHSDPSQASEEPQPRHWTSREWKIAALCLSPSFVLAGISLALIYLLSRGPTPARHDPEAAKDNAFVKFLSRWEGEVTVVVPDFALVMVEVGLKIENIPLSLYTSGHYPEQQLSAISDPRLRQAYAAVAEGRSATFNEAMVASDFVATMGRIGLHAKPRYSRDLHVSDLNEGNSVLIGGPGSDPWVSLFTDKMNFQWIEEPAAHRYYFLNARPARGEQSTYAAIYSWQGSDAIGYVDVALTQNPTHTGYILLILGSDQQEAESAANLLLRGKLPPEITALLERKDLRYFELFFRGKHIAGQADNSLELVAYRPL